MHLDDWFNKLLNVLTLTPFIVCYLVIMDIIYIIESVLITPLAMFVNYLFGANQNKFEEKIDSIYNFLFGMSTMDIKGFRRLRTIS